MKKRLISVITVLAMLVAMLPTAVFATDAGTGADVTNSSKTLTVDASATEAEGETYTTIQAAINYIYGLYKDDIKSYTYKIYTGQNESDLDEVQDSWYLQAKYGTSPITYSYKSYPEEMSGWTINVKSGTYSHFSVYEGLDGITIKAADNATVTVNTWTGATNDEIVSSYATKNATTYRPYTVTVGTRNITLDGLDFTVGEYDSGSWCRAAVTSTSGTTGTDNTGLTVKNCNFTNLGEQGCGSTYLTGEIVNNMGIVVGFSSATITGCTFSRFGNAGIAIFADGRVVDDNGVNITNNTFTSCDYALNCYYGGNSSLTTVTADDIGGKVSFTGNTVTGTSTLRSKVCIMDQGVKGSIGSVDVSNNYFTYTMVVIENMDESPCEVNDVLAENTWSNGSFYVDVDAYYWDGTYQGTLTTNIPEYAYYESPESDTGYWVLNVDLEDYSSSTNTEYVQALIDAANEAGSHTLSITFDDDGALTDTITALKDCIYWVSGTMPTEKEDLPGLDKTIVLEDGSEVDKDDVAAGDTVDYKLTSNVPSTLDEYIDYTGVGDNTSVVPLGTVKSGATYTLTFHDTMDSALALDASSFVVKVGDTTLDSQYYTFTTSTTDDCTFEVSMDLLALYTAGIITEDDFGSAEIVVTFSAKLSSTATAGAYKNTAWVVYPDGQSKEDTVEVDTYKLSVFKYDQDDNSGLAGAVFTVTYPDGSTRELTSNSDGYATLDGLDAGTYTIQETTAPEGYVKADTVLTVVIPTDVTDYVASVSFANAGIPSTGGAGTTMYTVAGICIILAAGLALVVTRKTRKEE